ncbi:hypothetical protein [Candidatus Accumulibacter phosphatis]|uniref:SOS-response repressor and protease LexA n=1 Tax=Candidatus Accumulibacter phosphatis TaxID=327160 RepID=A0A5S4ELA6_9PROT|nr:SOS-response repressor and protease LexA [Candidatus Accumulibacter phosphatis]
MPSLCSTHPQEALTPRQREILDFIRNRLTESGAPPTRLEICAAFGFASPNGRGSFAGPGQEGGDFHDGGGGTGDSSASVARTTRYRRGGGGQPVAGGGESARYAAVCA